ADEQLLPGLFQWRLSPARRSGAGQVHHGETRAARQSARRSGSASDLIHGFEVVAPCFEGSPSTRFAPLGKIPGSPLPSRSFMRSREISCCSDLKTEIPR